MSVSEVGKAIDLKDPALLELVENGKIALPFEIILRLASVLGRNDPISFVMRFTRSYNPDVWKTLESLGIGRLALQAGREREFANLYRANDAARRLSDEEFADGARVHQGRVRDGACLPRVEARRRPRRHARANARGIRHERGRHRIDRANADRTRVSRRAQQHQVADAARPRDPPRGRARAESTAARSRMSSSARC